MSLGAAALCIQCLRSLESRRIAEVLLVVHNATPVPGNRAVPPLLSSPLPSQPRLFLLQGAADLQHQGSRFPDRPCHQTELDPSQQARPDRLLFLRCHAQRVPDHQRGGHQGRGQMLTASHSLTASFFSSQNLSWS